MKAKKIAIFNHKSSVSKTTSVFHIGWKLSQLGKKVLLVDADSQCNLTLFALGEENFIKHYQNKPNENIKSALTPAFKAHTSLIKPVECIAIKDNLFILPGHLNLGNYEVDMGVAIKNIFPMFHNLPGSFSYLFEKTAEKYDIDFILIDMNPSISAINQVLLINSDFFIVPTSPDYFSSMAISSLSEILPSWELWAKSAREIFKDVAYPLPTAIPKFLGYTINDFSIRKGLPSKGFRIMIENIDDTVNNKFIPELQKVEMLLSKYPDDNYCLGKISDFASLIAKSMEYGVPVYDLSAKQIETSGFVLETQKKAQIEFGNEFTNLSNKIIKLINNE